MHPLLFSKFPPDTLHVFRSSKEVVPSGRSSHGLNCSFCRWVRRVRRLSALLWGTLTSIVGGFEECSSHHFDFYFYDPKSQILFFFVFCLTKNSNLKSKVAVWLDENTVPCWVWYSKLPSYSRRWRWREDGNGRRSFVGEIHTLWVGQVVEALVAGNAAGSLLRRIQQTFGHKHPNPTSLSKHVLALW